MSQLIAITGATGFVGRYVLQGVLNAGHSVRALVRPSTSIPDISHPELSWLHGNIESHSAAFLEGVDTVIHIAGVVKAQKRSDYYDVNEGLAGLLADAAHKAKVGRLILISSMAAKVPELSDYAGSKKAGELAVKSAYRGQLAIIRAPAIFGPGDIATAPFFQLIHKGLLPVPGGKGWRRRKLSFAYVYDLSRDISDNALSGVYDGQIVSPASAACLTWYEFAKICEAAAGRKVRILPIPLAALYAVASVTSTTSRLFGLGHLTLGKLREFLYEDWSSPDVIQDATSMKEAVAETLLFYRDENA